MKTDGSSSRCDSWPLLRRRQVLATGVALAAPCRARAAGVRRVGILGDTPGPQWNVFRKALANLGYVEGSNVAFESRFSLGDSARFPELAVDIVRSGVEVIVAEGGLATAAAKKSTRSIPIVMAIVGDPVGSGLVTSLAKPGGNVTGMTSLAFDLTAKQLHDAAFQRLGAVRPGAVLMLPSTTLDAQQSRTADLATRERLPALYNKSDFCRKGGLICYGARYSDFFERSAAFVDDILKGARPENLPVQQPTIYDLVINLQAAKALGIAVPNSILSRADEVIQ